MKVKTTHDVVAPQKCKATGKMYVIGDSAISPIGFKFESPEEMVDLARTLLNMVKKEHDLTIWFKPKKGQKPIDDDTFLEVFKEAEKPLLKKFKPAAAPKATPMKKKPKKGAKK